MECSVAVRASAGIWQEEWRQATGGQENVQRPPDLPNRLCWHLLISEFTWDLLNRLYWSRPPNINCDQTKYTAGSKIWLKICFELQTRFWVAVASFKGNR